MFWSWLNGKYLLPPFLVMFNFKRKYSEQNDGGVVDYVI